MATLRIHSSSHERTREHVALNRVFVGSVPGEKTITLDGTVAGTDYADAKAYLDQLDADWSTQEAMTFGPAGHQVTGKIERLAYALSPGSRIQKVSITLKVYP